MKTALLAWALLGASVGAYAAEPVQKHCQRDGSTVRTKTSKPSFEGFFVGHSDLEGLALLKPGLA